MDANQNAYPAIFNTMGATDPSMSMQEQYRLFCLAMRESGANVVHLSAYLSHFDVFVGDYYQNILKYWIKPLLSERAELMDNSKSPSSPEDCTIAFVWDIDSMTMISRKHMRELEYLKPSIDPMSLYRLMDSILMSVDIAHEDEIEAGRVENILDVFHDKQHYMESTAPKYYALKKLYDKVSSGSKKKKEIISYELLEKCNMVDEEVELCQTAMEVQKIRNQRWKIVKKSLNLVNRRSAESKDKKFTNVVMTNEGVANAAVQLMISGLSSSISIDNIYSRYHNSEEDVWRRIQRRFGENCLLIYVTPLLNYRFPREVTVPVWHDKANESITLLYDAQKHRLFK